MHGVRVNANLVEETCTLARDENVTHQCSDLAPLTLESVRCWMETSWERGVVSQSSSFQLRMRSGRHSTHCSKPPRQHDISPSLFGPTMPAEQEILRGQDNLSVGPGAEWEEPHRIRRWATYVIRSVQLNAGFPCVCKLRRTMMRLT
jgi:hypothetical protein